MPGVKKVKKSEARVQAESFQWFNNSFPHLRGLMYHVPNGELRDPITANKLKAMGVVPGIPDIVFHYRSRTYFFEFKKPNEKPTEDQLDIHKQLDLQRFMVWVVDSQEDFQRLVEAIIEDTSTEITLGLPKEDYIYRHKIFSYLYSMVDGQLELIEDLASDATRKKFMYYVQEFIVEGYDKLDGFEILFTPDYKAIYKKLDGSDKVISYGKE